MKMPWGEYGNGWKRPGLLCFEMECMKLEINLSLNEVEDEFRAGLIAVAHLLGVLAVSEIFLVVGGVVFGYECREFIFIFKRKCVIRFLFRWTKKISRIVNVTTKHY